MDASTRMGHDLACDESLIQRLPLPLAQLYRRAHNAKNALDRHLSAYYLWEASLKLLASVAVVAYAERPVADPQVVDCLCNLVRPSLGHWWEFVRRLLPALADGGDAGFGPPRDLILGRARDDAPHAAGLDAALRTALDGAPGGRSTVRLTELFDRLVRYRNRELGHGAAGQRGGDFYDHMGRALLAGAAELLGRLDPLAGRRLLHVAEVRRHASGAWLVERFELIGESPRRIESLEVAAEETARLPHPERLHLEADGLRPLHPLALFDAEAEEVLFLNARRGRSRAEYLSYTSGRTVECADVGGERRELLARALGLSAVGDEQVRQWEAKSAAEEAPGDPVSPVQGVVGEFELLSELGRGGMGVVYRAWQPSLGRQVALKELLTPGDAKAEARFRREIRALGKVEHPHLVKIFTSGSDGARWYYAMELVEGAPLSAVCDRLQSRTAGAAQVDLRTWQEAVSTVCTETRRAEKPLGAPPEGPRPAREPTGPAPLPSGRSYVRHVAELMRQTAEAAHALHEAGVVHRDVKPGNILVTADGGQAVLMDLGLAQLADESDGRLTRTRQFVGTLRYASPQQVLAVGRLDRRSDVYSLGATLWELLTLRPLFGATEQTPTPELMEKIQRAEPGPLRRHHSGISKDLEAIVQKCLEKDPARRYTTAAELAADLRRFLDGEPVRARPVGGRERALKWMRRHPSKAAAAGLLLALAAALLAGGAVSTYFAVEANNRSKEIEKANEQLDDGNKRLEQALAVSLLRPLGQQEDKVAAPEIEALWDLASLPREQERVRVLFIEQVLRGPVTTRQLRNRADLAMNAAVGLDPRRRRRAEEMLLARILDRQSDLNVRADCVIIGRCLDGCGPEFAAAAARQCVAMMGEPQGGDLEEAWLALAERLRPDDAADVATQVRGAMKAATNPPTLRALARAVAVLGREQRPDAGAQSILEAMNGTDDTAALRAMAEAYSSLAGRLGRDKATRLALSAADRIENVAADESVGDLCNCSRALSALAPWLEQEETSRRAEKDCRRLLKEMGNPHADWELSILVGALSALAPRLGPAAAADASRQVLGAMDKPAEGFLMDNFAGTLSALAPRLQPDDAAEAAGQALEAMNTTENTRALRALARAAAALKPWAGFDDQGRRAEVAAGRVVDLLGRPQGDRTGPRDLAEALTALAPWLGPKETARLAAAAESRIEGPLGREDNPYALSDWAMGLAAVAPWIGSDAAARQASGAAWRLKDALHTTNYNDARRDLAEALSALAPWLTPKDAGPACREVMKVMAETKEASVLCALAQTLADLGPCLGSEEEAARQAHTAARKIGEVMGATTDPDGRKDLKTALSVVIERTGSEAPVQPERWIACAAGNVIAVPAFLNSFALTEVSRPSPGRLTEAQLIELLKTPTTGLSGRQVIVEQLGRRCGRRFADEWEFVDWAHENRRDLDLTSPPVRPDSP